MISLFAKDVIHIALELAEGDVDLLVGDKQEKSVTVYNNPEAARRARDRQNKKKKRNGRYVLFDKSNLQSI